MHPQFSFFLLIFSISLTPVFSQPLRQVNIDGEWHSLAERMSTYHIPGAGLAIVRNGEPDTALYLGSQNREAGIPVSSTTLFQMGSMTTPLAKFAVVRLANDGRIDLDRPVNEYLTSWKIPEKKFTRENPVTVRDLLLEKRGFTPVYKPEGYQPGQPLPTSVQIMEGDGPANTPALKLEKSEAKKSSLANAVLLQLLLEDVHDRPFAEIMRTEVFAPLEMSHSIIAANIGDQYQEQAAVGYLEDGRRLPGDRWNYPELSHSGLWSTPVDYAKFVRHLFRAASGLDNSLLQRELALAGIRAQHEYHSLILHQKENGISYWGGAPKGFYSQFAGNFEEGWVVVGCTNRELAWKFVNWELNKQGEQYAAR